VEGDPLDGLDREECVVRWLLGRSRGWSGGGGSVAWVAEEMREVLCSLTLAGWLSGPRPRGMRRGAASKQLVSERGERADGRQQTAKAQAQGTAGGGHTQTRLHCTDE
jgi:hypothetical protein